MEILAFDIVGKFAHFRKFFANSSALSYFIPPRTTICGMIAGILGLPRDSYYENFNMDNCSTGVRLLEKIKKSTQTLKYLKVESPKDLNGSYKDGKNNFTPNTMVPFEFLSPLDIRDNSSWVKYRIYYTAKTSKHYDEYFFKLRDSLMFKKSLVYPLTLGVANFTALIENVQLHNIDKPLRQSKNNSNYKVHSVVRKDAIKNFEICPGNHIMQETIPLVFDKSRYLTKQGDVIFDLNCNPISLWTEEPVYCLKHDDETENIIFL